MEEMFFRKFSLFLFDFDGLLVDTEQTHYQAYMDTLKKRGNPVDWDFNQFCSLAHLSGPAIRRGIVSQWPAIDPVWDQFYAEKKKRYYELLKKGCIRLMPGAKEVLTFLASENKTRVVVTNSPSEQTDLIRSQLPVLNTIPHWITRENYEHPKPSPECYLKAIDCYGKPNDQIVGFEDSVRGLAALKQTPALPVLICPLSHPLITPEVLVGALRFDSLNDL
jgi:HAD superfamily hydrolase (TIGR01509 family)